MAIWIVSVVGTFALSLFVASVVLRLRCRGIGPPFGPRARYWACFIVADMAIVSTGAGMVIAAASRHLLAAYAGITVPASLCLSSLPPRPERDLRPRTLPALLTLPLARLYDRMGDDMQAWCDVRLLAVSFKPQDIADAVNYYYIQVAGRLTDSQARSNLERWQDSINHKIGIVRLIDRDVPSARLRAALAMHPDTEDARKYYDADRARLAQRMKVEALNELTLFLVSVYPMTARKMLIYPFRPGVQRAYPAPCQPMAPEP